MIHNEIVLAVKSNGNKVIGKDKEVEVKYLLFFQEWRSWCHIN